MLCQDTGVCMYIHTQNESPIKFVVMLVYSLGFSNREMKDGKLSLKMLFHSKEVSLSTEYMLYVRR